MTTSLISVLLAFFTTVVDLGQVRESEGPVACSFLCANDTGMDFSISSVSASCSCVSATWPVEPIRGGQTAEIAAVFNPAGLDGPVVRTLTVWENPTTVAATLEIRAEVISDRRPDEFPLLGGKLAVNARSFRFGYVRRGTSAMKQMTLRNVSGNTMKLSVEASGCFEAQCPQTLAPGQDGLLTVRCTPQEIGSQDVSIRITAGGEQSQILAGALCIGPEAEGNAPSMQTTPSPVLLSRGLFRKGWKGTVELNNNGVSTLEIYKVEAPEGVSVDYSNSSVPPGGREKIAFSSGFETFSVKIFTNDPKRPCREIRFANNKL